MKKRWSLILILVLNFTAVVSISAQTRTVTNENLEKYRQKRLAAERDLRENYERLGFPSPAELEKQSKRSRVEKFLLAARLEAENLERERLNIERQRAFNEANTLNFQLQKEDYRRNDNGYYNNGLNGFYGSPILSYPSGGFNRYNRGGFGNRTYRRSYDNQPRVEYRNNLPVLVRPPQRIFAPGTTRGGRRN